MSSEEIRKRFLDFFIKHDHTPVSSSSLIPADPSVLLTTAGMQQFKSYYTGELDAIKDFKSKNVVSIQKCFRTGDIDEVGDATHNTFFEMLGNFSFGGYWKKEAITLAYELFTKQLEMPISYVTIFKGSSTVPKDEESRAIWKSLGIKDENIREEGMEDVFWGPTGTSGPCGPTTEIYCKNGGGKDVEVWNIVFNEFSYPGSREELLSGAAGKKLEPLRVRGIDTGAGLERITMTKQGVASLYETDLFTGIMQSIPTANTDIRRKRILADHARAISFLIADGVRPSNKDAGYILRRLMRRIIAHEFFGTFGSYSGTALDTFGLGNGEDIKKVFKAVVDRYSKLYPELNEEAILGVFEEENKKYGKAIIAGIREIRNMEKIDAADAFFLYETFGLPYEAIKDPEISGNKAKNLIREEFDMRFNEHQEISRAGAEKKFGGHGLLLDTGELKAKDEVELKKVTRLHTATHLLQAALRQVLGNDVRQAGSDITAERTRFDFTFPRKLTPEELKKVEAVVNEAIQKDLPVSCIEMPKAEAEKTGALYFFKAKYSERVKVYCMGHSLADAFSKEFCGGPHVDHTALVGKFKIAKEEAVAAGVRRIRGILE